MTMEKWRNVDAGPRQVKDLQTAISHLSREGATHDELSGVVGGAEHTTTYWVPIGGGMRPEVLALDEAIREKYGYEVTRKNVRAIVADYEAALPEAAKSRKVVDSRRTAEEDAEIRAKVAEHEAGWQAQRDDQAVLLKQVMAKAPANAQALIVAQLMEDTSEPQTDYFANKTTRSVAIGFRTGKREDFRQLHAAAAQFPETAETTFEERRDNYSMGKGNYLSDHGWDGAGSGWVVKSYTFPATWAHLTEDAVPDQPAAPATPAAVGEVTVSEGRNGNAEIRFPGPPPAEVRKGLKANGFRWNGRDLCWYGKNAAYARSLASEEVSSLN